MGQSISEVVGFAVGVAISPFPIIAVILMLFTPRARINGPMFGLGWVISLAVVCSVAFALADASDAATSTGAVDTIAWGKVMFGVVLLALAVRTWRRRPTPGQTTEMPKWMTSINTLTPGKAFGLGLALAGVNPKNLMLAVAAGTSLAMVGPTAGDAAVALIIFVVVASITIIGPVVYYLVGGASAEHALDQLRDWLATHNDAVMAVLLLVFGINLTMTGLGLLA
jgi:threonine/homoserine/homoserine lactone efflux protein